ncbi:MAG: hypothetical protein IKF78_07625 [Atopobiaceae bacterium]|nr:hypothetical protein [Atopobiaceae bacterium]
MALDWKKEISLSTILDLFGRKKKNVSASSSDFPSKTTMNLYQVEKASTDVRKIVIVGVLLAVGIGVFVKFGVIDQLALISAKEGELAQQETLLQATRSSNGDYENLKEVYDAYMARYGSDSTDVIAVLDMVEKRVMPKGFVSGIVLADDVITLTLVDVPLNVMGDLSKDLENQPLVSNATVSTSTTKTSEGEKNVSTLVLTLVTAKSEEK